MPMDKSKKRLIESLGAGPIDRNKLLNVVSQTLAAYEAPTPGNIDGTDFEGDGKIPSEISPTSDYLFAPALKKIETPTVESDEVVEEAFPGDVITPPPAKEKKKKFYPKCEDANIRRAAKMQKKQEAGVAPAAYRESLWNTRTYDYLSMDLPAVHFVLNRVESSYYYEAPRIAPTKLIGIPAFGNPCTKNAFEHFMWIQNKIREYRGKDPKNAPDWILISQSTSMLSDLGLIKRLSALQPETCLAGAFGFNQVRADGKWWNIGSGDVTRGNYVQANIETLEWDYVRGKDFHESDRYRTLIIHGPFIAVRGSFFMQLDFTACARGYQGGGYWHMMAELSMMCAGLGKKAATLKTHSMQYDSMKPHIDTDTFKNDHKFFVEKWIDYLPVLQPDTLTKRKL